MRRNVGEEVNQFVPQIGCVEPALKSSGLPAVNRASPCHPTGPLDQSQAARRLIDPPEANRSRNLRTAIPDCQSRHRDKVAIRGNNGRCASCLRLSPAIIPRTRPKPISARQRALSRILVSPRRPLSQRQVNNLVPKVVRVASQGY